MSYFDTVNVDNKIHHCFNAANEITLTGDKEILLDKAEVSNYLCYELGIRSCKLAYRTDHDDDSLLSLTYTF